MNRLPIYLRRYERPNACSSTFSHIRKYFMNVKHVPQSGIKINFQFIYFELYILLINLFEFLLDGISSSHRTLHYATAAEFDKITDSKKSIEHPIRNNDGKNIIYIFLSEFSTTKKKSSFLNLFSVKKPPGKRKRKNSTHSQSSLNDKMKISILSTKQMEKMLSENLNTIEYNVHHQNELVLTVPKNISNKFFDRNEFIENIIKSYQTFLNDTPKPDKIETEITNDRQRSYDESVVANLKAYLDACCNTNMTQRGLATLNSYLKLSSNNQLNAEFKDINLFQSLMSAFAANGNWSELKDLCGTIIKAGIPFTPKVYATIFECVARKSDSFEYNEIIKRYQLMAKEENLDFNDIIDKSLFARDQREYTIKAMQRIEPNFQPKLTPPVLVYTNPMLKHLNSDVQPIDIAIDEMPNLGQPHKISKAKRGFSSSELRQMKDEQLNIESSGILEVKNISLQPENVTSHVKLMRHMIDELFSDWHMDICRAIERKIPIIQKKMMNRRRPRVDIYPYLRLLPTEKYADILMEELKQLAEGSASYTPTVLQLSRQIGEKVHLNYCIQQRFKNGIVDKTEQIYDKYSENLTNGISSDNPRQLWQRISYHENNVGPNVDVENIIWPWPVLCEFGRFLFRILLEDIKINTNIMKKHVSANYVPALYIVFRNRDLISREEIRIHPVVTKLYIESRPEKLSFPSNLVPMLCPPIPWISPTFGGYFITHSDLLRLPFQTGCQLDRIKNRPASELYPALDALNQLGCVPWRVNTRILDLVIEIFNKGGSDKLNVPKSPDVILEKNEPKLKQYSEYEEISLINNNDYSAMKSQMQAAMYSLWCDTLYKLSLANHFRDKVFWLPHNMDFRGRVYPIPPHLNHLSSDMSRSLLFFHEKQPLGSNGLRWLKLHCINLTGSKKRESIETRLEYAEEVLVEILDSADNPINGKQWWLLSDEPWQTLACCMEIADAVRSSDPEKFMSSFPIHQDGSCNGLQHYASLGRDHDGAVSVNLSPCDTPQDVYSSVAALVEKARERDAKNGLDIAIALDGLIKRKVIKQTVMTTVYGVTMFGARLQIEKQLKAINTLSNIDVKRAASYLSSKTFSSLGEMFTSAREIQNWFTDCARFISKHHHMHVEWVTPLGLPVVQPYLKKNKLAQTKIQNIKSNKISDRFGKVNSIKEKNAFPPNFVHSLDSCHMMLTSVNCEKSGITFVSVHDCFWTHANSVPLMNKICRDQFVLLHSQPILEDLSKSFMDKYEK